MTNIAIDTTKLILSERYEGYICGSLIYRWWVEEFNGKYMACTNTEWGGGVFDYAEDAYLQVTVDILKAKMANPDGLVVKRIN